MFENRGLTPCVPVQLYSMFSEHGEIAFARLCTDRDTQRSRGFGFVSYKTKEAADRAIQNLNGTEVEGRQIEVKEADRERSDRPPRNNFGGDRGDRGNFGGRGGDRGNSDRPQRSNGGNNECFAFKKGNCKYGDSCRFSHENGGASRSRGNDYEDEAPRKQFKNSGQE